MPASNKKAGIRHYLLVGMWLGCTFFLAAYFIQSRLVPFDPQGQLMEVNQDKLSASLLFSNQDISLEGKGTLIHIWSSDCRCNTLALGHKRDVSKQAESDNFHVLDVELDDIPGSSIIPSTPAVALIDSQGQLAYFGPYSTGLGCGESSGLIEVALNNLRHGFNPGLIVYEAKGCYCNV